jgi:CheY-like chemotaxis protein
VISKRLVEMMGGHIEVESTPGRGSKFSFTVKLERSDEAIEEEQFIADAKADVIESLQDAENVDKTSYRILMVEDNAINQQVALRILQKLGYHAEAVNSGMLAIQAMKNKTYDLILMDCQMPGMDGYQTTGEIRKLEFASKKHIPIIAITAHALIGDKNKCIAAGMDDYISKPININELNSILSSWLVKKSLIDIERVKSIFGDDTPAIKDFFELFISTTDELLQEIEKAINSKNLLVAKDLIHRLKGSSGNSGINLMYEYCIRAEEKVIHSEWLEVESLYKKIMQLFQKLKVEVVEKF